MFKPLELTTDNPTEQNISEDNSNLYCTVYLSMITPDCGGEREKMK